MREAVVEDLVVLIGAVESDLSRPAIRRVVDEVVTKEPMGLRLLAALDNNPALLTAGSPQMPTSLARILLALTREGATTVLAPGCARCGRAVLLNCRDGENGICAACGRARLAVKTSCNDCGRQMRRHATVADRDYCRTCWDALQPSAPSRIARFAASHVPGSTPDAVAEAVVSLGVKADRRLRLALECDLFGARWVTDPAPASLLFVAFYDSLLAHGATLPARSCGHCGRTRKLTERLGGLICCRRCYRAGNLRPCDGCGKTASIELRRADGSRLCQACTNLLNESWAVCVSCGNRRLIASRTAEGPMCSGCRTAPGLDVCTACDAERDCRFPGTQKAICLPCYAAARIDACSRCGQERECRFAGTERAICEPCALRREPCSGCSRVMIAIRHTSDGAPLCWACAPAIIESCTGCGRQARVSARTESGPLCQRCARKSPLMFRDCFRCGTHGRLHKRRWCDRCYADDKIRDLLPAELIAGNPALMQLRERCLAADARRTLHAFRRNTTIAKLREALRSSEPLSHDLLDGLGTLEETGPVRSLLVGHGLLPPRDDRLVRFERWCADAAAAITDPGHRRTFDRFVRWRPLRELRDQDRPVTTGQSNGRREQLRQVSELLEWLTARSESLADLDQARLDLWLMQGTPIRRRVVAFLRWASHNRLCPRLRVPPGSTSKRTPVGVSVDERWELLRNLLREDTVDPRTRLAGVLVLLFGIRVMKLHTLRVTDIVDQDGHVTIRLGPDPLELPDEIGQLAIAARDRRHAPRLLSDDGDDEWLFPGQHHGAPLSRDALTDRLNTIGVRVRAARTGALVSLVQELPAPVIARLTGMHVASATGWADAVSASHARYTALLTS